ncbi:MAG TPA: hypothetical protein VF021_01625 [Longimicrobiales bacterium]
MRCIVRPRGSSFGLLNGGGQLGWNDDARKTKLLAISIKHAKLTTVALAAQSAADRLVRGAVTEH